MKRKLAVLASLQWLCCWKVLIVKVWTCSSFTLTNVQHHLWCGCKETAADCFLMTFIHINEGCTRGLRSSQWAVHSQGSVLSILKLWLTRTLKTAAQCGEELQYLVALSEMSSFVICYDMLIMCSIHSQMVVIKGVLSAAVIVAHTKRNAFNQWQTTVFLRGILDSTSKTLTVLLLFIK